MSTAGVGRVTVIVCDEALPAQVTVQFVPRREADIIAVALAQFQQDRISLKKEQSRLEKVRAEELRQYEAHAKAWRASVDELAKRNAKHIRNAKPLRAR